MTVRDLLRRTPLRLAAAYALYFATTVLLLFAILWFGISARLNSDIRTRVQTTMEALVALDAQKTFDDLVNVVSNESESVRDSDFIFEIDDQAGAYLAGNVRDIKHADGWLRLKRDDIFESFARGEGDDEFLAIWRPLSKGRLLVGSSNRAVRQMQSFLLKVLGLGLVGTAAAMAAGGMFLARRAQRRIDAFATTMSAISQGHITARVPISGSRDDIDQVALKVNRTLEHLQRLIANVNQSSSDIAHDLKKPIGRLRQRLEEVRRESVDIEDLKSSIDDALDDLDSITVTFDALLRITQIEAGARKSRFVDVDLASLVDDVADAYSAVAEDAGDQFSSTIKVKRPALVHGDRELLAQLAANLVENAIRHCPPGTRIALDLLPGAEGLDLVVSDTGPGIPAEERENVFRRLYRLERARSTEGSGLGLSLVAAVAELHDAPTELVDNEPGLKVIVHFPRI